MLINKGESLELNRIYYGTILKIKFDKVNGKQIIRIPFMVNTYKKYAHGKPIKDEATLWVTDSGMDFVDMALANIGVPSVKDETGNEQWDVDPVKLAGHPIKVTRTSVEKDGKVYYNHNFSLLTDEEKEVCKRIDPAKLNIDTEPDEEDDDLPF